MRVKKIELTQEQLKEIFVYSVEEGVLKWKTRPRHSSIKIGDTAGSLSKSAGYFTVMYNNQGYQVHRLIWIYVYGGIPDGQQVEHIDGDKENNRASNLRLYTPAENMKKVLTQGRLKELLFYDENIEMFRYAKPRPRIKVGDIAGYLNQSGYRSVMLDGKHYLEHRLIWLYFYGEFPSGLQNQIDHIDGNRTNNKLTNLRLCSNSQNQMNTCRQDNNTSGFRGVSYHKLTGKYQTRIKNPSTNKREYLGLYLTAEEASEVYEALAKEYFKGFKYVS